MQNQSHTRTTRLRRWTLQHAWRDLGDAGEPMLQVREQRGRHGRPVWSLGNLSVRVEGWARWAHVDLPKKGAADRWARLVWASITATTVTCF